MEVDLTGSKLGPAWKSVRVVFDFLSHWSDDHARELAAKHYGVPFEQVGAVELDEGTDA